VAKRIDKASRLINAPPSKIYEAFATPDALETWLPPHLEIWQYSPSAEIRRLGTNVGWLKLTPRFRKRIPQA